MSVLVETLIIFLIVIIIGYVIGAKKVIHPSFKAGLNFLLLKIALPAMILNAIVQPFNEEMAKMSLLTFGLTIVGFMVCFVAGSFFMKIFKISTSQQGVWLLGSTFSNLGFMGFPLIEAIYGADGLFLTSIVNIGFVLCFYSFGIWLVSKGKKQEKIKWREIFFNNVMIAILLGLVLYFTRTPLPGFIEGAASMVGAMTAPLSMLVIGLKLSEFPLKEIFNNLTQYQLSFVRLVVSPLVFILLLKMLPLEGYELMISILAILNAMPVATNTAIIASEYGGDEEFAAKSVTLSTILCLATTPIVFMMVN